MYGAGAFGTIPYGGAVLVITLTSSSTSSGSMSQTTIQQEAAIRKGSVKVQVGNDFSSLVDIGALRNPVFTSLAQNQKIEFDNVDSLKKFVDGNKVQLKFDLAEINLTNMSKLDAGLIELDTVDGTPASITNEQLTITADSAVRLVHKNGDNTRVTISAVNLTGGGASQTEGTHYEVFVDAEGYTNIVKIGTGSSNIEVDYTYTPAASKVITMNASGTKTLKALRIVNTDENGKEFRIDMEDVTNLEPISIKWASDTAADVGIMPVSMEGTLVEIVDEQQTA